jgi:hypothetical protein
VSRVIIAYVQTSQTKPEWRTYALGITHSLFRASSILYEDWFLLAAYVYPLWSLLSRSHMGQICTLPIPSFLSPVVALALCRELCTGLPAHRKIVYWISNVQVARLWPTRVLGSRSEAWWVDFINVCVWDMATWHGVDGDNILGCCHFEGWISHGKRVTFSELGCFSPRGDQRQTKKWATDECIRPCSPKRISSGRLLQA